MYWKKLINITLFAVSLSSILTSIYLVNLLSTLSQNSRFFRPHNNVSSLKSTLQDFPWKSFNTSAFERSPKNYLFYTEELINQLIPFVTMEPLVSINETCQAPQFKNLNCSSRTLKSPRRIAVLLQFGFDVDNLEIHLNELHDIVDRFFILESVRAHFGALRKPLVWEIVKNQERFRKFLPKIVHFVLDDSEIVGIEGFKNQGNSRDRKLGFDFGMERLQERVRWEKFQVWNNFTGFFRDDDLLGFGDADEIPSRDAINHLKNCEFEANPVDIGIWFPFGRIDQAFQTDFPVSPKHSFSLGDPTYWKLKTARAFDSYNHTTPSRNRGWSGPFILGGMHMSHYGYLPYQIIKRITQTESHLSDVHDISQAFENYFHSDTRVSETSLRDLERIFAEVPPDSRDRIYNVDELKKAGIFDMEEIAVFAWFYDCNRLRYLTWEGGHDTRLD